MSDIYDEFYKLYRRAVHAELQLVTTINVSGEIAFTHPELGAEVTIHPSLYGDEMDLSCVYFNFLRNLRLLQLKILFAFAIWLIVARVWAICMFTSM